MDEGAVRTEGPPIARSRQSRLRQFPSAPKNESGKGSPARVMEPASERCYLMEFQSFLGQEQKCS